MFNRRLIAAIGLTSVLAGGALSAQNPVGLAEPGDPTSAKPGILSKIAIDQRIGHTLPLDAAFVDDHGRNVRLGDYFGRRPVVLALVYYECPMLCTQVLNGLVSSLGTLNLTVGSAWTRPYRPPHVSPSALEIGATLWDAGDEDVPGTSH